MGPSLDFEVRRSRVASAADYKKACRQPKANKVDIQYLALYLLLQTAVLIEQVKKTKNISRDTFGTKFGRVHMQRQDFSKLQTRKIKGLKRTRDTKRKDAESKRQKID